MSTHGVIEVHPEELEPNQDSPLSELPFGSLQATEEALSDLAAWLAEELERAKGARNLLERLWEENLRLYEGVAENRVKNIPIENASNIEVTLGAIAADTINAQMVNLIFTVDPILTVRQVSSRPEMNDSVKALQRFVEVLARSKVNLRGAVENALLDDVKLGTGILYTRWAEVRKKTVVDQVLSRGPLVKGVPVEDFFVPGGAYDDLQRERWVAMRQWLTRHELALRARDINWDITGAIPSPDQGRIRKLRERLGNQDGQNNRKAGTDPQGGEMYEVFDVYCYYDIDGDGIDEDLLVTFDWGSKRILRWRYNPFERRPFDAARYQKRSYLFNGLGVIEMIRPYQRGVSNLYNYMVDNSLLANARFWAGRHGAVQDNQFKIWPNRFLPLQDPANDIRAIAMADVWPSSFQAINLTVQYAERRTGISELSSARPSGFLGTRTPGVTALAALQQTSQRFGPAFDSARLMVAGAVKQCLYRYQERLLANDEGAEGDITDMLGEEEGRMVVNLLRDKRFDDTVSLELTASSAQTNKETERQNWLLILQQLTSLGERIIQLAQVLENPQIGPITKQAAEQLVKAINEMTERTLRTFDQIRDPRAFLIELDMQLAQENQGVGLDQLAQALGAANGQVPQEGQGQGAPGEGADPFAALLGGLTGGDVGGAPGVGQGDPNAPQPGF